MNGTHSLELTSDKAHTRLCVGPDTKLWCLQLDFGYKSQISMGRIAGGSEIIFSIKIRLILSLMLVLSVRFLSCMKLSQPPTHQMSHFSSLNL